MRYITLTSTEEITLKEGYKFHLKHYFRQKCYALLLSNDGMSVPNIAKLLNMRTRTIYKLMDEWQNQGISSLTIRSGRGRKPKLSVKNEQLVELIKKKS